MKQYDKYKDSGIEWVGKIPSHWVVKKVNYCFELIGSGTTPTAGNPEYYENGEYNWLQTGDLNDAVITETSKMITQKALDDYSTLRFYPQNSLVIAMYGATIGKTGLLRIETTTNQACCVLSKPKNINHRFAFFWFNFIKQHVISLSYGGGQPNINQEQIRSLRIQCPSIHEQTAIANYLDHKTAEIDELIADKKRLLELYEEEKTAIINQAVTKGINPDVKMKDSGIEWLGEIPEHWEVKKLRYIKAPEKNSFVDGPFGSNLKTEHFIENGDVYVIDSGFITSGKFEFNREFKTISIEHFLTVNRSECKANDIIIAKIGANFGMSGILPTLDKPSLVSGNTLKLTVNTESYDVDFIHMQLLCLKLAGEIDLLVKGSAQPALSMGPMSELNFAVPKTIQEQQAIVNNIESECDRIAAKKSRTEKLIDLLTEYRTALISEVVTGKIKVTE